jgi:hypothetical protein
MYLGILWFVKTCNLCTSMGLPSKVRHVSSMCLMFECIDFWMFDPKLDMYWAEDFDLKLEDVFSISSDSDALFHNEPFSHGQNCSIAWCFLFSHGTSRRFKLTCGPFLCHDYTSSTSGSSTVVLVVLLLLPVLPVGMVLLVRLVLTELLLLVLLVLVVLLVLLFQFLGQHINTQPTTTQQFHNTRK